MAAWTSAELVAYRASHWPKTFFQASSPVAWAVGPQA